MATYRVFPLGESGGVIGSHDFEAPSDPIATAVAILLSDACSDAMNWDQINGDWKQAKGKVKEQWGKLTDDEITQIDGKRDQLVGRIQERYGIAKEAADKQVNEWESRQ